MKENVEKGKTLKEGLDEILADFETISLLNTC